MQRIFYLTLFTLSFLLNGHLHADCQDWDSQECVTNSYCSPKQLANQLYIGPEIYYATRNREGGTKQHGPVFGVKAGYDHIKRYKLYWGGEVFYGAGHLKGKTGTGSKLKSRFIDFEVEGRLGYTFQQKAGCQFAFTPYIGYGYAEELNKFIHPSPLKVHFRLDYTYVPVGFLSQVTLSPLWTVGLNFKAKFMIDAKNRVTHDEDLGHLKMLVKNEIHYRVEGPLTYQYCSHIWFSAVPYYEFRHYGQQSNFPFDFQETKLNLYGIIFKLIYCI